MTYNVLFSTSNENTLEVLRTTGPDIVGLQEISSARLGELGRMLGYYYHSFTKTSANLSNGDTGILSRFPILRFFPNGAVIKVNPTLAIAVFTVHLQPYPYEPYDFRDGLITTAEEAINSATINRLPDIEPVLIEIAEAMDAGYPVFLTGDFNEPSFLDWTDKTADRQMHFGKVVEWPVSKRIIQSGMADSFREMFPDPANVPGNTWTTFRADNEVYDRIDMIYHSPTEQMTLGDIRTVGGLDDSAGITVPGYPSDHYAVIATYHLTK